MIGNTNASMNEWTTTYLAPHNDVRGIEYINSSWDSSYFGGTIHDGTRLKISVVDKRTDIVTELLFSWEYGLGTSRASYGFMKLPTDTNVYELSFFVGDGYSQSGHPSTSILVKAPDGTVYNEGTGIWGIVRIERQDLISGGELTLDTYTSLTEVCA